jgi:hypothetical protein
MKRQKVWVVRDKDDKYGIYKGGVSLGNSGQWFALNDHDVIFVRN